MKCRQPGLIWLFMAVDGCGGAERPADAGQNRGDGAADQAAESAPSDAGADATGDARDATETGMSDTDASGDRAEAAPGPCDAFGRWKLTYAGSSMCKPIGGDTIAVKDKGGGTVEVWFEGEEPGMDTCGPGPPTPGKLEAKASLSSDGCTLTATWNTSWCTSGEGQCEKRELKITIAGDAGAGTLDYGRCWCDGGPGGKTTTLTATAARLP